ncbi:MAG: aspartate kinase [Clostridia bacterium]|nr:aspartate kinase [Clostridia bacterium]MDY3784322.1 aspartate kinase [Eubacteriales bacterium]
MQIKVVKFGGSSLADAEHFRRVADIIRSDPSRKYVVASAPGKRYPGDVKVTDMLYNCYEMIKEHEDIETYYSQIKDRYYGIMSDLGLDFDISGELEYVKNAMLHRAGRDYAASRGEYINSLILAKYLGFDFVDAENVIIFREDGQLDEEKTYETMRATLARHEYAVIPGFYGCMPNGTIKTFTRGGSDVTGSIVASAVNADLYENWTDVSGFMMADPRIVEHPLSIDTITYRELRALSYMGATVLHEEAIFPVRNAGIPINIRNTNAPADKGTMIVANTNDYDQEHIITALSGKKGFSVITIEKDKMSSDISFVRRLLEVLEDNDIALEHIPSGIDTISLILSTAALEGRGEKILAAMNRRVRPDNITIEDGISLIAVVGRGMVKNRGVAARVLSSISEAGINIRMIDQGSSEFNIIVGVEEHDFERTINSIYKEFVN